MDINTYRQKWQDDDTRDVQTHRQLLLMLIQINSELLKNSAERGHVFRRDADDLIEYLEKADALWSILRERDDQAPLYELDDSHLVRVELKS